MRDSAQSHMKVLIGLMLAYLVCGVCGWYLLPQNAAAQLADIVTYKPPKRGAPGGREGAGTRGLQTLPTLAILTPKDHTGLTVQEQPVLYWYLSQETQHPVDIILTDRQSCQATPGNAPAPSLATWDTTGAVGRLSHPPCPRRSIQVVGVARHRPLPALARHRNRWHH